MSSASGIYQAGTKDCAEKRITMNNQEMMELTTVDKSEFEELVKECTRSGSIDQNLYIEYDVKRGLRDSNGNGVLTGLTEISDVCGNENVHGRKIPVDGQLYFQGYNVQDIIKGSTRDRFRFEEATYLLLFGNLPTEKQLDSFLRILADLQELSGAFIRDVIMKATSTNLMNSLMKSILSLYSYDENPDDISIPNVLRQSLQLIAKMPLLTVYAYQSYRHFKLDGDNNDGIWGSWRDYKALTKEQYRILEKCTSVMKDKLNHYGRSNEKFGLIHADLHFYNVINNNGVNQIIDFDDSGYGFYMYDMGCALVTYSRNLTKLEGAWVRGYEKVRKLSDEDKKFIPMFVLLRRITRLAWLATHSDSDTAKTVDDEYLDVTIDMAKEWLKANTKVAVITGAAGGIGYGIAKKFLESCK